MRRVSRPLLCATCCAAIGCAAPFRAGAPIEIQKHWYGTEYRQAGRRVDAYAVRSALEDVGVARADARASRRYEWAGGTLLVAGAAAFGWGLGDVSKGEGGGAVALAAAGAAGAAVGFVLLDVAFDRLETAARAYNVQLVPAGSRTRIAPWATVVPDARDGCVAGGLVVVF